MMIGPAGAGAAGPAPRLEADGDAEDMPGMGVSSGMAAVSFFARQL